MSDTTEPVDAEVTDESPTRAPVVRGMIDGSLNNSNALNAANIMGAMVNSRIEDNSNNNANTRAAGKTNNAINE